MRKTSLFMATLLLTISSSAFSIEAVQAMGQALFEQTGSNSCMFCHGIDGKKGNVAVAANLATPKVWKSYKALGGDAALAKDRAGFTAALKKAVTTLIKNGAIRHNATYKEAGFNWKAAGVSPFNSQMVGLGGAASQSWLKRMTERGVTPDVAADSLWLHLAKLDSQGVLSK